MMTLGGRYYHAHLTDGDTEAPGGYVICLNSHSESLAGLQLESDDSKDHALFRPAVSVSSCCVTNDPKSHIIFHFSVGWLGFSLPLGLLMLLRIGWSTRLGLAGAH